MPYHGKQAQAIFLKKKRELGEKKAREWMRRHGNKSDDTKGKQRAALDELRRGRKRRGECARRSPSRSTRRRC